MLTEWLEKCEDQNEELAVFAEMILHDYKYGLWEDLLRDIAEFMEYQEERNRKCA